MPPIRKSRMFGNIQKAAEESTQIYSKYGVFTTAASVIATWAVIQATFSP